MCHGHRVTRSLDLPSGLMELDAPWPEMAIVQAALADEPPATELPDDAHAWSIARKSQWWNGRRALRAACHAIGVHADAVTTTSLGAPQVAGAQVSIAHTHDIAVAVATKSWSRVGIDVERADRNVDRLEGALSADERTLVGTGLIDVLSLVMAKEAASKAMGTGLEGSLHRWPVSMADDEWVVQSTSTSTSTSALRIRFYGWGDWRGAVAVADAEDEGLEVAVGEG